MAASLFRMRVSPLSGATALVASPLPNSWKYCHEIHAQRRCFNTDARSSSSRSRIVCCTIRGYYLFVAASAARSFRLYILQCIGDRLLGYLLGVGAIRIVLTHHLRAAAPRRMGAASTCLILIFLSSLRQRNAGVLVALVHARHAGRWMAGTRMGWRLMCGPNS